MPEQTADIEDFFGQAPSAGDSRDSALQYVAADILEAGGDPEVQEDLVAPVEDDLREHVAEVLRAAIGRAFRSHAEGAAEWAVQELTDRLEYDAVPAEHREEVKADVEKRLEEKQPQLATQLHDVMHDARQRAVEECDDLVVDWEGVL